MARPAAPTLDLYCGAGGLSLAAYLAAEELGIELDVASVNHWPTAVETNRLNHPRSRHYCRDAADLCALEVFPGGHVEFGYAGISCTFFSNARAGQPTSDQQREHPWQFLDWLSALRIDRFLVENVPEFRNWGPVDPETKKPIPSKKGQYFKAWVRAIRALGYRVEWAVLCCADYGDATTRRRFFMMGRLDRRPIRWPEPTHSREPGVSLSGRRLEPWRSAAECIDWTDLGRSLFDRPQPHVLNTRLRIAEGLRRYAGALAPHYIRLLDLPPDREARAVAGCDLTEPFGAEPFLLGQQGGAVARPVREPVPTIATDGAIRLFSPMVVPYYGTGVARSTARPLATVTTRDRFALCTARAVRLGGGPFLIANFGERPGQRPRVRGTSDPLWTVTGRGAGDLVSPTIEPCDEAPAGVDARRLLRIDGELYLLDILYRMLFNRELAAATSFDVAGDYHFVGTDEEITQQIGNAIPVRTGKALARALMAD